MSVMFEDGENLLPINVPGFPLVFKMMNGLWPLFLSENILINFFSDKLSYSYEFKLIYLIFIVIFTFFVYLASSVLTKAFKLSDIKLNE